MDDLRDRVAALERALSDGEGDLTALAEGAATAERVTELETELETLREEVDELVAATQALRGYVGNVRSVNESVEQRADAAVAAVDSLEARVDRLESNPSRAAPDESTQPDRAGPEAPARRTGADHCEACGQPTAAAPAGSPETGTDERHANGVAADDIGGFEPDEAGDRVRISRDGGPQSRPPDDGGGVADVDEHLVDRLRNLL